MNSKGRPKTDPKVRFLSKVQVTGEDGCWVWTGKLLDGYGQVWCDDKYRRAHRVSYELFVGPLQPYQHVHHRCDNRACVRWDHLEALSPQEHALRTGNWPKVHEARRQLTHCKRGHPFEGGNLQPGTGDERICLQCKRERQHQYCLRRKAENPGPGKGSHWAAKTHCPQGHPYEGHNLLLRKKANGGISRQCRACRNENEKRRHARHRAAGNPIYTHRKE